MNKTCKLVKKIELLLKQLNCREYLHQFGPKKFKTIQHLFALLFMQIAKLSFRRASELLVMLNFEVPSYSALCKSRARIPIHLWNSALKITSGLSSVNVAIDSTGISRMNPSYHYIKRIDDDQPIKSYVKLSAFFCIENRKFLALRVRAKPRHDVKDFDYLFKQNHDFQNLFADSAYDSEKIHEKLYWSGIQAIIKPKKRTKRGFFRKKQMEKYSTKLYHQRSLIESGWSSLKRKYGGYTLTKNYQSARAELYLKAIAFNLSLLQRDFQQSRLIIKLFKHIKPEE